VPTVTRDRRDAALRAANRGRRAGGGRWWRDWLRILPAALVLFLAVRTFVVEAYRIPSGSMEGTLLPGDFLLVNKWVYGAEVPFTGMRLPPARAPRHNDIIVFDWPVDRTKAFVKRLVGLPGDTVAMRDGLLLRNGRPQREPFVSGRGSPVDAVRDSWGPLVVPAGHFFVLGDNRAKSLDSRYWGFVPDRLLRGTPWLLYYSFVPDSSTAAPWLTRIRWDRIGNTVRP
jgi:signal peptidase I